jgi:phosphatidyl-myo-inositol dimannoside synthase
MLPDPAPASREVELALVRLLEITNDFPPSIGGIENYTYALVNRWSPDDVVVVAPAAPGTEQFDRALDYEVVRFPSGRVLSPSRRLLETVAGIARRHRADVVHFSSPFPIAFLGPKLLERSGLPYAVTLHGGELVLWGSLPATGRLMRRALEKAALLLPVSSFTSRAAQRLLRGHMPPCVVVTPGVDCEQFAPAGEWPPPEPDRTGPTIVSVCRLVARKGPATLIRSLPRVLRHVPRARAVIVGDGPDRPRLERLAAGLGVDGAVRFTGPQPWHDVPRFYREADVFAMPTRERFGGLETEGFPLVYLEAAASGLPSIAGDAGGVRDAVLDGVTGYVVDGRNPTEVSASLVRLLGDPEHARRLGGQARRRVEEEFSWNHVAGRFRAALEEHLR